MPTTKPRNPKPGTSLAALNSALADQWHHTLNGALTPNDVTPGSAYEPWWTCPTCSHVWTAPVYARTAGNGCPACRGLVPTPTNSLQTLNPAIAGEWHHTRNGTLTPNDVTPNSNKTAWWHCTTCQHDWPAVIASRARNGNGCPACSGRHTTPATSLHALNPAIAGEWHPAHNGTLTPHDVTPGSNRKVYWLCRAENCGHTWQAYVYQRTRGEGCPSCGGVVVTPMNCLATRRPDLAAQWHPQLNDRTAANVTAGTAYQAWWFGPECGHAWQAAIYARANGNGCPDCWASAKESRQETELRSHLAAHLPLNPARQVPRTDGRRRRGWQVDILSTELKLIIEFDGSHWHGTKFPKQADADRAKSADLRAHGYTVIRVRETPLAQLHPDDVIVPYLADATAVAHIVLTRLRDLRVYTPAA
ncbi:zinc-ribbon domain-containing protein [Tessaracoccus sp.]